MFGVSLGTIISYKLHFLMAQRLVTTIDLYIMKNIKLTIMMKFYKKLH